MDHELAYVRVFFQSIRLAPATLGGVGVVGVKGVEWVEGVVEVVGLVRVV